MNRLLVLPSMSQSSPWPGDICWNAGVGCQAKQMQEDPPVVGEERKMGTEWEVESDWGLGNVVFGIHL